VHALEKKSVAELYDNDIEWGTPTWKHQNRSALDALKGKTKKRENTSFLPTDMKSVAVDHSLKKNLTHSFARWRGRSWFPARHRLWTPLFQLALNFVWFGLP
jgi:hypothetical protein